MRWLGFTKHIYSQENVWHSSHLWCDFFLNLRNKNFKIKFCFIHWSLRIREIHRILWRKYRYWKILSNVVPCLNFEFWLAIVQQKVSDELWCSRDVIKWESMGYGLKWGLWTHSAIFSEPKFREKEEELWFRVSHNRFSTIWHCK